MSMNSKDANKLLTRALFVLGADTFERRFVANPQALRDLFAETMKIAFPAGTFVPKSNVLGVLIGSFEKTELKGIDISVYNLFESLDRTDMVRAREGVVSHVVRAIDAISSAMNDDPDASLKGPLLIMAASDGKIADYKEASDGKASFVTWKISRNLNAIIAVEGKAGAAYLSPDHLPKLGLTEETVKAKAVAAMEKRAKTSGVHIEQLADGVMIIDGFDGLAPSLLALEEAMQGLRHRVGGDAVILADEGMLMVADQGNPNALAFLMSAVADGKVDNMFSDCYFMIDAEGVKTLGWAELTAKLNAAAANWTASQRGDEQSGSPTIN